MKNVSENQAPTLEEISRKAVQFERCTEKSEQAIAPKATKIRQNITEKNPK